MGPSTDSVNGADLLAQRVGNLRKKATEAPRATESFKSEGVIFDDGAILYLDGELTERSGPRLEELLDRVIGRGLACLMVDLSQASRVSSEALGVINARRTDVDTLEVRLPTERKAS
jgi:ABC-type transporter Mla MlaB component